MKKLLKNIPLFSGLDDEELDALANIGITQGFTKDRVILNIDEEGDSLHVICRGRVKVYVVSESGKEVILSMLGEGDFFGEMSLLDGLPRSAYIASLEDSEMFILRRNDFHNLIKKHPHIAITLLRELSKRLRKTDQRLESLALLDVTGRIAGVLLQLADEQGENVPEGIMIRSRPTHQDMANMAGTTRETVTRVLKQLEIKGYISMSGKEVLILSSQDMKGDFSV